MEPSRDNSLSTSQPAEGGTISPEALAALPGHGASVPPPAAPVHTTIPIPAESRDPRSEIAPNPNLPVLTPREHHLLTLFIANNFNLPDLSDAPCLPEDLLAFTTSPSIQAHLEAIFKSHHLTTQCKATLARQTAIDGLISLLATTTDPREKRLLLQSLLRATTAPIVKAAATSATQPARKQGRDHQPPQATTSAVCGMQPDRQEGRSAQSHPIPPQAQRDALAPASPAPPPPAAPNSSQIRDPRSEIKADPSIPAPPLDASCLDASMPSPSMPSAPIPDPTLTSTDVAGILLDALAKPPAADPAHDPALAAVANFADALFTINGIVHAGHDPRECFKVLQNSLLRDVQGAHITACAPARLGPTRATFTYTFTTPDRQAHRVTLHLTRNIDTRQPDCWMLASLSIRPP